MFIQIIAVVLILPLSAGNFYVISDIHLDIAYEPDYNSSYYCHSVLIQGQTSVPVKTENIQTLTRPLCDSSFNIVNSTLAKMQEVDPDPDFILITGDFIAHYTSAILTSSGSYSPSYAQLLVQETFQQVTNLLIKYFPNTMILPLIGNNDGYEDYDMPSGLDKLDYLEFLYSVWQPLIKSMPRSFFTDGYYAGGSRDNYHIIVLNSNFFSINYNSPGIQGNSQMVWLKDQLEGNSRIFLIMHIPPSLTLYSGGKLSWYDYYSSIVVELINQYSSNITAILAGHYHSGSFQLIGQVPIAIHHSISPYFGNNPGFRYYYSNFTDFVQYNLDGYNVTGEWESYSFSSMFGYELDFMQLYEDLDSGKVQLYEYLRSINGLWLNPDMPNSTVCKIIFGNACSQGDAYIKQVLMCQIINHTSTTFEDCMNNSKLIKQYILKNKKKPENNSIKA